jgi:hypothetical protein
MCSIKTEPYNLAGFEPRSSDPVADEMSTALRRQGISSNFNPIREKYILNRFIKSEYKQTDQWLENASSEMNDVLMYTSRIM